MLKQSQSNTGKLAFVKPTFMLRLFAGISIAITTVPPGWAQSVSPTPSVSPTTNKQLAERERAISNQMRELEATFLRLADLLDATDPRRAITLRSAFE